MERDVCISKVQEYEIWETLRYIYGTQTITPKVQIKCFNAIESGKNIIFHSFNFDYLIEEEQKKPYIPTEFVLEDNIDRPQKEVFQRILIRHPTLVEDINKIESIFFFCYDEKLDRFAVLSDDIGMIRGVSYRLEDEFKKIVPWMIVDALTFHYAGEAVRLQYEEDQRVDKLRIRIPSPALTPPKAPRYDYIDEQKEELDEIIRINMNSRPRSRSWCEWMNCWM